MKDRKKNPNRITRRVDPVGNNADNTCLILAMLGHSNRAIYKHTGLSNGQISYRMRLYEVSRMDYRNGEGKFAKAVLQSTQSMAEKALLAHLRTHVFKEV